MKILHLIKSEPSEMVKKIIEAAEKFGHGQIRFAIPVVHRGIEQHRLALRVATPVTTPEVSVQQRGQRPVVGEKSLDAFEQARPAIQ